MATRDSLLFIVSESFNYFQPIRSKTLIRSSVARNWCVTPKTMVTLAVASCFLVRDRQFGPFSVFIIVTVCFCKLNNHQVTSSDRNSGIISKTLNHSQPSHSKTMIHSGSLCNTVHFLETLIYCTCLDSFETIFGDKAILSI